jgi:hypothetical protein
MKELACRACRDCPGIALRTLWAKGWRPHDRGGWRLRLSQEEGVALAQAIYRGASNQRLEVETTAKGSTYYLLMGERDA